MPSIINIESFISILTFIFFVGCICFYISKRSGSSFSFVNKVVSFLYSKQDFHSKTVNKIWHEREDVERFNAIFSTRAENINQINEFYLWVSKLQLDFKMLTTLGGSLNMRRRKIVKMSWFEISFTGLLTPVMAFASFFILLISLNNYALIKLDNYKDIGWFWINGDSAYSLQAPYEDKSTRWKVYKTSCNKGEKNERISEAFNKMLCESFNSEESLTYINNLIESQKTLKYHAFLIMFFAFYMYSLTKQSLMTKKARQMVYARTVSYLRAKRRH